MSYSAAYKNYAPRNDVTSDYATGDACKNGGNKCLLKKFVRKKLKKIIHANRGV